MSQRRSTSPGEKSLTRAPGLARRAGISLLDPVPAQPSERATTHKFYCLFLDIPLLIGMLAVELEHVSIQTTQLIQFVTILTFVISSYRVFHRFPTPIGVPGKLMRD